MVILLRTGWQSINIGDISHTAGFILMAQKYLPDATVIPWVSDDFPAEEEEMFRRHFPEIHIVKGRIGENGEADHPALGKAIQQSDWLIHNSGPMLVAKEDVEAYANHTGKPFGVWGITYDGNDYYTDILNRAAFLFFRDSVSMRTAKEKGLSCPTMGFVPDVAFFVTIRDDEKADAYLKARGLEKGAFFCCIPRLRYTPFWTVKKGVPFNAERQAVNDAMKAHDHRFLIETITALVREKGKKVLICPEDQTQILLGKELLYDCLPEDVKQSVVWKQEFWLPDEAISVYRQSAGLFGNEMHSPIMCIGNGIPAVVCRWKEQTSKGFMWQDMGLEDWLFDLDDEKRMRELKATVLRIADDPQAAHRKVKTAVQRVRDFTAGMVKALKGNNGIG